MNQRFVIEVCALVCIPTLSLGLARGITKNKQTPDPMHSILTSDRYIAIRAENGKLANYGKLRILTNEGVIHPAKWVAAHERLESCSLNSEPVALPMYRKSKKIERALSAAKIEFAWLTREEAKWLLSFSSESLTA